MKHDTNTPTTTKRSYRRRNPMMQLVKTTNKNKTSFNMTCATNKSLYLLVNLEAMMSGKSVSTLIEEFLMARYGERVKNFDSVFANLRNLENR